MCQNFNREVCGGWFDGGYQVSTNKRVGGKMVTLWKCPVFDAWSSMLYRVNVAPYKYPKKYGIYADVEVCKDWLLFSNFKEWFETNYVDGWFLDKDLSNPFLSEYSPATCMFVPPRVNALFSGNNCRNSKSTHFMGVYYNKERMLYQAQCSSLGEGNRYLGRFKSEMEGHRAWLSAKIKSIEQSKNEQYPNLSAILVKWQGVLQYALDNEKGVTDMKLFVNQNPESWNYWMKPKGYKSVVLDQFLPKEN